MNKLAALLGFLGASVLAREARADWRIGSYFDYHRFAESEAVTDYLRNDRDTFEKSMPGFKSFLTTSGQLPTIGVNAAWQPEMHLLPRDVLELLVRGGFSSSKIFGSVYDKKTFDANVVGIEFGDTPTAWEQSLNFYGKLGIGISYSPMDVEKGWFKVRPLIAAVGGLSYIDSESVLHIHVNDPSVFNQYGREVMNSLNIYQDIRTVAKTSGSGWFCEATGGLKLEFGDNLVIPIEAGYMWERMDDFTIDQRKVSDGKVEEKKTTIDQKMDGYILRLGADIRF